MGLKDAAQAEWEQFNLYIDPRVRAKSSKWLLTHQTIEGSWEENTYVLDREKFQVLKMIFIHSWWFFIEHSSHFFVLRKRISH